MTFDLSFDSCEVKGCMFVQGGGGGGGRVWE